MRKLSLVVAATSLMLASFTVSTTSAAAATSDYDSEDTDSSRVAPVVWGACANARLTQLGLVCATLTVPMNYDESDDDQSSHVELALSMLKHTVPDDQYQGVMLVNPGGPGGSGLGLALLGGAVPNGAGGAYDWIGFDPRGVGASKPALSCIPDYNKGPRPDYIPSSRAIERAWLARAKAYADACAANQPELIQHVKTIDSVRDMDRIRRALGKKQINFYGFSYGTYLGQVYATKYPKRVRRMVLDSNVDSRNVWYVANLNQDVAFEKVFKEWYAWTASYDAVYHLGATADEVEERLYAEQDLLRQNPAGGIVGPAEWTDIFTVVGYAQQAWPALSAIAADWAATHDPVPLLSAYDGVASLGNDNGYAMYLAVQCTDIQWPESWRQWRRDNKAVNQTAPFLTWGNAWFNAPCLYWHAEAGTPVKVDGRRVQAPILLIDETLDGPTPYEGSLYARKLFPTASLLAEPGGTSHANSLAGNVCVDTIIADYLATGALPARQAGSGPDAQCDPLPRPVPDVGATNATDASGLARFISGAKAIRGR